jgi:hypothetical protein
LVAMNGVAIPQEAFLGDEHSFQATARYGHGLGVLNMFGQVALLHECPEVAPWAQRRAAQLEAAKGPTVGRLYTGTWDASIFPNCSYLIGTNVFKVWHPIGPDRVEVMTWTIVEKEMPDDMKRKIMVASNRAFGSAGTLESDDLDNFEYGASANRGYVTRQGRINTRMGMGTEREHPELPGVVGAYLSEVAIRGFYRFYADCLSTNSWQELEAATANWKQDILRK